MDNAVKKFLAYAVLAIFILLTALLAVINGVNFTMAADDADRVTAMLSEREGSFGREGLPGEFNDEPPAELRAGPKEPFGREPWRMGPMGPDSPEIKNTIRYFTFAFDASGENAEKIAFQISAVSEEEASEWARTLLGGTTGWTNGTYRYRVYKEAGGERTYVTVIDQGRELLPSYRILIISAIGEALCLIISLIFLTLTGRRVFAPIEEADRKQKKFISRADREFRLPLTVISANTELIERAHGPDIQTESIRRQVKKLGELVEKLGSMGLFDEKDVRPSQTPISDMLRASLGANAERFAAKGLELNENIASDIMLNADPEVMKRVFDELIDNALKYALTSVTFGLRREGERIILEAGNDTDLPEGSADQVFDRFTKLSNAENNDSAGLGLSYVKDTIKAHDGRVTARVSGGRFTVRLAL